MFVRLSLAIAFLAFTGLATSARAEADYATGAPQCGDGYYPYWDAELSTWFCHPEPVFNPSPGG
jgi:hypothetical protein